MAGLGFPRIRIDWGGGSSGESGTPPAVIEPADDAPTSKKSKPEKRARPLWVRLLALPLGGVINLMLWCVVAGLLMQFTGYNPYAPPQSGMERAETMWDQAVQAAGFAFKVGWKPALAGASVVLPIWLVWRTLTLPFRR